MLYLKLLGRKFTYLPPMLRNFEDLSDRILLFLLFVACYANYFYATEFAWHCFTAFRVALVSDLAKLFYSLALPDT